MGGAYIAVGREVLEGAGLEGVDEDGLVPGPVLPALALHHDARLAGIGIVGGLALHAGQAEGSPLRVPVLLPISEPQRHMRTRPVPHVTQPRLLLPALISMMSMMNMKMGVQDVRTSA